MYKYLLLIFSVLGIFFMTPVHADVKSSNHSSADTVYFNVDNNTTNTIELAIRIFSPTVVNSLDFLIKINPSRMEYDTMLTVATYLDGAFAYYDHTDSTLRFSSYSLQQYINEEVLVIVRFKNVTILSATDLSPIKAYINGEAAETELILPVTGIAEEEEKINITTFPNPAKDYLHVVCDNPVEVSLMDIHGRSLTNPTKLVPSHINTLSLPGINPGIYFLRVSDQDINFSKKIIISK